MSLIRNQTGYTFIELIIVLALLAAFGFIGYRVLNNQQPENTSSTSQPSGDGSATANDVRPAPQIKSNSDLDKAQVQLDQTDPSKSNDSDTNKLDAEMSSF